MNPREARAFAEDAFALVAFNNKHAADFAAWEEEMES